MQSDPGPATPATAPEGPGASFSALTTKDSTQGAPQPDMRKIETVRDLRGEAYKILRQAIADGTLPPGQRLKETDLARDLSVSRTPIREALQQLSKEGFVVITPRQGAYVRRWTREEALEILLIREVLEGLAARLAASSMSSQDIERLARHIEDFESGRIDYAESDRRFHEDILRACGMKRLIGLIRNLYDGIQMFKVLNTSFQSPERIRQSIEEHRSIIRAFRAKDPDLVEQAMRNNFRHTRGFIAKFF